MLVNLNKTAACICPFCSSGFKENISIFDFSGKTEIGISCPNKKCSCKDIFIVIAPKGKKYSIHIECPICGGNHSYSVNEADFRNKKLIKLKCPEANMDIFVFGNRENVDEAFSEAVNEYMDLIDEITGEQPQGGIMFIMLEYLDKLINANKIKCSCGNKRPEILPAEDGIEIYCNKCGRRKTFDFDEYSMTLLLQSKEIIL